MTDAAPETPPEDRNGLPFPIRVILKCIMWLGVIALVFWGAMSLLMNYYLKPRMEMEATVLFGQPAQIAGGIHLGTDFAKPSIVLNDIMAGESREKAHVLIDSFEAGMKWQSFDPAKMTDQPMPFFVDINNVRIDGKPYGSYEIPITALPHGDYTVKDFKGVLDKAFFTGTITKLGDKMTFDAETAHVDYGQIVADMTGGDVKAELHLTSGAGDLQNIVSTTNGTFIVAGVAGTTKGDMLKFWAQNLASSMQAETKINCTVADFGVVNGVATAKALIVDTPDAVINGTGTIDFAHGQVNLVFTPTPKTTAPSLATPVTISGPFGYLTVGPDTAALAAKLGGLFGPAAPVPAPPPVADVGDPCLKYLQSRDKKP